MAREESRSTRARRIDQPQDHRRAISLPKYDADAFGRISDRIARFLGTWKFIGYMTLFIAVWLILNLWGPKSWQFDPERAHFTLLTLLLSLQASYAAPLILLAQNRQSDRDRVQFDQDRALSERAVDDTEYLTREVAAIRVALGEVATRDYLRSEMQRLLEELVERDQNESGEKHEKSGKGKKDKSDKKAVEKAEQIVPTAAAVSDAVGDAVGDGLDDALADAPNG